MSEGPLKQTETCGLAENSSCEIVNLTFNYFKKHAEESFPHLGFRSKIMRMERSENIRLEGPKSLRNPTKQTEVLVSRRAL